ncbi:MAG: type II toxin-antitoxin system VapC family toxin [Methanophagales archaeon]|nr:type II toxin-antitoxin system VapC family toxin [Methanophagales archaeon]
MRYLDANVFIYAALYEGEEGDKARKLIKEVREGEEVAFTSALTFDEFFWIVKKERGFDSALEAGKALLEMPNLTFLDVDDTVLWQAYNFIKRYKLNPRDAIHLSCAFVHGIFTIISEDEDFDKVKEVERKRLEDV